MDPIKIILCEDDYDLADMFRRTLEIMHDNKLGGREVELSQVYDLEELTFRLDEADAIITDLIGVLGGFDSDPDEMETTLRWIRERYDGVFILYTGLPNWVAGMEDVFTAVMVKATDLISDVLKRIEKEL